jgi:hypothetical protein
MNNPLLIPVLLKDTSINNGFIYNELRKTLPCRIGIEFEAGKSFIKGFNEEHKVKATNKYLTDYYHVKEIKCDKGDSEDDDIIENRISIKDYKELKGLYRFMQDLSKYCTLHEGGGIHIHVDISPYRLNSKKEQEVCHYIKKRLDTIKNIFPKYTGKYNKKDVGIHHKATWVNISNYGSIEFRIAPLTFDYSILMSWIVKLVKFRNKLINDCNLLLCESLKIKEMEKEITELILTNDDIRIENLSSAYNTYYIPSTHSYITTGDLTYTDT